ncbi:MAG: 4Fe-4S dicluster domain-containing protein [Kiritimatiellaeota bacterium]|nr:4Fe-4S dicluster domain-containing protein [Kiritimatiellota bacterium]
MTAKTRGYNLPLAGRPVGEVTSLPVPDLLRLPLQTERFRFAANICVQSGQTVAPGTVLATDPGAYDLPLLAPRPGVVRTTDDAGTLVLERVSENVGGASEDTRSELAEISPCRRLVRLGAWAHFYDVRTRCVPDPDLSPAAVVVTTFMSEPVVTRGSTLLRGEFEAFLEGLKAIQSLLDYQPILLLVPRIRSALGEKVVAAIRGEAWVKLRLIPARYPYGDPRLHLGALGLARGQDAPVWGTDVAGVLAVHRALVRREPVLDRVVAVGGPGTRKPAHFRVVPGTPVAALLAAAEAVGPGRVIRGDVLTGSIVGDDAAVDIETRGITVVPVPGEREFLSFLRPGSDRASYSRCFLSLLRKRRPESMTTGLRGEVRPCVACGLCEQVCPVEIFPHLIHRALYQDSLEEVERLRLDLCIDCGLCTLVCPSKIDLAKQFRDARLRIQEELHSTEDHSA